MTRLQECKNNRKGAFLS